MRRILPAAVSVRRVAVRLVRDSGPRPSLAMGVPPRPTGRRPHNLPEVVA